MYHPPPTVPIAAGAIAFTGMTLYTSLAMAVALLVVVGVVLGVVNLLPRLAWEPIDGPAGPKMRVTLNGRPIRGRN